VNTSLKYINIPKYRRKRKRRRVELGWKEKGKREGGGVGLLLE